MPCPTLAALPQANRTLGDLRLASVAKSQTRKVSLETRRLDNLQGLQVTAGTTLNKMPPPPLLISVNTKGKEERRLTGRTVVFW